MKRGMMLWLLLVIAAVWLLLAPRTPNSLKDKLAWAWYDIAVIWRKPNPPDVQAEYDRELVEY